MGELLKQYWIPITAMTLFMFFATFNLFGQYSFNGDPARDTLQSLRILRNKEITFVGPPLSLGQNGLRETYFSSAIYYIGVLGFLFSNTSIIGPVIIIGLINASGVLPLFLFLRKRKIRKPMMILFLLIYITNPIVVSYSRIFWNPSPLIGIGVWALYFLETSPLMFGFVSGLALYFHYFSGILMLFGNGRYLKQKEYKKLAHSIGAFLVSLLPFFFFEIRNAFYLSLSFLYNIQNRTPNNGFIGEHIRLFLQLPADVLGVMNDPFTEKMIHFGIIGIIVGSIFWIVYLGERNHSFNEWFFTATALVTALASTLYIRTQYVFIAFGALLFSITKFRTSWAKMCLIAIVCLQCINSVSIILNKPVIFSSKRFPSISQLEQVNEKIQLWHSPGARFNITENITGDARAHYLRYFLEKDMFPDLQDELNYENLDELYVLTPSLKKTRTENRWEFTATTNLSQTQQESVGAYILLKLTPSSKEN